MRLAIFNDCVWNMPRSELFRSRRAMSAWGKNRKSQSDNGTGNVSFLVRFGASFVFNVG